MQRKTLRFAQAKVVGDGNGTVEGYASVFGGIDSYGDQIVPGAFAGTIAEFLGEGFVAWSHDWEMPVATPSQAYEDVQGLFIAAEFHSDEESQRIRTIVAERLTRGKEMGLSIGYDALAWEYQQSELAVPTPWGGVTNKIRLLKAIKLYEVSLVMVPADDAARVTGAKGERYADHAGRVLAEVEALCVRVGELAALRAGDGRSLSDAKQADLAALVERLEVLNGLKGRLATLLESTPAREADLLSLYLDYQRTLARLNDVAA